MMISVMGLVLLLSTGPGQAASHADAAHILSLMKAANASIVDMKCSFSFEVTKNGRKFPAQRTILRLRSDPETIHMTFIDRYKGRKILYVKGRNHGKMKVRPGGFWKFLVVSLDPEGKRAMEEAIDSVTAQGFPNIVKSVEELLDRFQGSDDCRVSVDWDVDGDKGVYARLRIAGPEVGEMAMLVDKVTYFPFQITKRKGGDCAIYTYEDIQLNPGMKDSEFIVSSKR